MKLERINTANNSQISFYSKRNPIGAYKIATTLGTLRVAEVDFDKGLSHSFIKRINKFFLKNFAEKSQDEYYLEYKNGNKKCRKHRLKDMEEYYREIFEDSTYDDNITLLIAKDKHNKIQGACLSTSCCELPGCFDTTLWVDALAVNKKYRNEGIARELITKIIEVSKKSYTDVFLTGSNFAAKFYEKLGFKELDFAKSHQRTIIKYLEDTREDFPEHVKAFSLILQPDKPRWFIKAAKAVKQLQTD